MHFDDIGCAWKRSLCIKQRIGTRRPQIRSFRSIEASKPKVVDPNELRGTQT